MRKATLFPADTYAAGTHNGTPVGGFGRFNRVSACLEVTAKTGSAQTLNVSVQHSINDGDTWHELFAFSQTDGATPSTDTQLETAVLGAGGVDTIGDWLRAVAVVTAGDTFDFQVDLYAR